MRLLTCLICGIILAACAQTSEVNEQEAMRLCAEAEQKIDAGQYEKAQTLLEQLRKDYPKAIEAKRKALFLSRRVQEGFQLKHLAQADSMCAILQWRVDSLKSLFTQVSSSEEPYFVVKGTSPAQAYTTPGLQTRLTQNGQLWLIACPSKNINAKRVSLQAGSLEASTGEIWKEGPIIGSDALNISGQDADTLGFVALKAAGAPIKISFYGKGEISSSLPKKDAQNLATAYLMVRTVKELQLQSLEKQRLERLVDLSRQQAAKTYVPDKNKEDK